ncbi:MAG: serpin family protein [Planctomycetes bacterium]|nr:serpin family protein [Planctomycetota bacterium]
MTAPLPTSTGGDAAPAALATQRLAFDLLRRIPAHEAASLSPYSVAVALAMTAEGARGATRGEFAALLGLPTADALGELHAAFAGLAHRYHAASGAGDPAARARLDELLRAFAAADAKSQRLQEGRDWEATSAAMAEARQLAKACNEQMRRLDCWQLAIANSLWVERSFPLAPAFEQALAQGYGAGRARAVDFGGDAERVRAAINAWIAANTQDRIRDLIGEGAIAADTRMVLANAVAFAGAWQTPFEASRTEDADFTRTDRTLARVPMMQAAGRDDVRYGAVAGDGAWFATPAMTPAEGEGPSPYPGAGGATFVELPYKGGDLAMVVLAPQSPDGLPALERLLTPARLADWLGRAEARTVDVALPRFAVRKQLGLKDALQALGLRRAFVDPANGDGADFGGMASSNDARDGLFVGDVLHEALVEVDEEGTRAVAATAVMMVATAMPAARPFVPAFRADRPFLFLIRDTKSGAILFLGRVLDPRR